MQTVKFYNDESLTTETGLRIYSAKPYLLVEYTNDTSKQVAKTAIKDQISTETPIVTRNSTPEIQIIQGTKKEKIPTQNNETIKTSIVYIADLGKPQYIKLKSGIGSSNLQLSLTNSILSTYGLTVDTKIPETLNSITGLMTGVKSLVNPTEKSDEKRSQPRTTKHPDFELYEIIIKDNSTILHKVEIK